MTRTFVHRLCVLACLVAPCAGCGSDTSGGGRGGGGTRGGGSGESGELGDGGVPVSIGGGLKDSDGDTISDSDEGPRDTDNDGIPDVEDDDSDNDGIPDSEEAGDSAIGTPPRDTDGDRIPDFQDPDSDDDGISDEEETAKGLDPLKADTDGDGVTDLVEIVSCDGKPECENDPKDGSMSAKTRGNFVFLEPYMAPPDPPRDTLDFQTEIRQADLYFLVDTTGSMQGAIDSLKAGLSTPMTGLIDRVKMQIPDMQIGVGNFRDYTVSPYGDAGDYAYQHNQDITDDPTLAQAAVNTLAAAGGGDGAESDIPALFATITGMGLPGASGAAMPRAMPCEMDRWGYPCFRMGSVPIIAVVTDVFMHNGPPGTMGEVYADATIGGHAPTFDETMMALMGASAKVMGISVIGGFLPGTSGQGEADLRAVATQTGAIDATGNPLVSSWMMGTAISDAVVDQIKTLANETPIDISIRFVDDPSDMVDTWAAFVDHLEANETGDPARGCDPRMATDTDGDGFKDTFPDVTPGNPVCFDIIVKENVTVEPDKEMPLLFEATLEVLGDMVTVLDSREVYFLVPPRLVIKPPE
jgi:hypothetical protein